MSRLIDESTANYVKYDDKKSTAYLKLRQEIFQLYSEVILGQINDDQQARIKQLSFDLDRTVLQYTAHVDEMLQIVEISEKYPSAPYERDLEAKRAELEKSVDELQSTITHIKQMQKPLLDKMAVLVKEYNGAAYERGRHARKRHEDFIQEALTYTPEQIAQLLGDVGFEVDVAAILNLRIFEKRGDKYVYKLGRQQVGRSIEEYDKLIGETSAAIEREIAEREQTKAKWWDNVRRLERIRGVLDDDMEVEGTRT